MNQEYDDDIYFVSSGRSEMYVEESRRAVRESDGQTDDAYNEYLNARRGNNSGVSPYGYSERSYDRTMQRHADPMWSDPTFGMGMGGFFGMRSYMLYNPYYPPFWSMQPGLSLSFNSMGGFGMGYGMGMGMSPFGFGGGFGGMYNPYFDPFMMGGMGMYNPYMGWGNPYMGWGNPYMGWHHPHHMGWGGGGWGGGWAGGGDVNGGGRLPVAPPRSGNVGAGTPRQSSLFNPNPGRNTAGASNRIDNGSRSVNPAGSRMEPGATPSRNNNASPGRETGNSGRRIIEESRPTRTPSRNTWDRGSSPATPSRSPERVNPTPRPSGGGGTVTPSRGGGSFDRGSTATPSRGGDSGGGSMSPSRGGGGGGGSRPSGGASPGRPR
ncbi:MAG: hypothetical protein Q8J69_04395 [Sphingobacteriaceae bacterium]|nr:hypothetical protein [Sphingobacteriaceae bacterium]